MMTSGFYLSGLHLAFYFAAGATVIAMVASLLRGRRYTHSMTVGPTGPGSLLDERADRARRPLAVAAPAQLDAPAGTGG